MKATTWLHVHCHQASTICNRPSSGFILFSRSRRVVHGFLMFSDPYLTYRAFSYLVSVFPNVCKETDDFWRLSFCLPLSGCSFLWIWHSRMLSLIVKWVKTIMFSFQKATPRMATRPLHSTGQRVALNAVLNQRQSFMQSSSEYWSEFVCATTSCREKKKTEKKTTIAQYFRSRNGCWLYLI